MMRARVFIFRCAVFTLALFRTWVNDRVTVPRDRASLLWDSVSVLFPSLFTIVRVVPVGDFVTVVVMDPAGFVTVCVLVVVPAGPIWVECVLIPLGTPIGGPPPGFLFRCAAKGMQTSKPIATVARISLRMANLLSVDFARAGLSQITECQRRADSRLAEVGLRGSVAG